MVFAKKPKLEIKWFPQQIDFKVNLTAMSSETTKSNPLALSFQVI